MRRKLPFHYGWAVVASSMFGIMACLGLGRMVLGMLLPSMGTSLGLSYSEMGFISTGNFVGYAVSVAVSGFLAGKFGSRRVIFLSLLMIGILMLFISRSSSFAMLFVFYAFIGMGSGGANVPIMGLVSSWFSRTLRGRASGFVVIGSGFAIMLSGWLIPFVNSRVGDEGWRVSWLVLGIFVLIISFITVTVIRNKPQDVGLEPLGGADACKRDMDNLSPLYIRRVITHLGAIYFLFGFTYVIYATFIVTSMVRQWGYSEASAGTLWMWIGALSLLSGPVFGTLSDKFGRKVGFITVFSLQSLSYMLAATMWHPWMLYVSVACFGVSAWSIPSIMAASVGDYLGAERSPKAFGIVTLIFAMGQIAGPAIAGMLADRTGSFSSSFGMTSVACLLAIILSSFLKQPEHRC